MYFNCPTFLLPLPASQLLADEPTAWAEKNPALYILDKVGKMRGSLGSRFQCKKKFLPSWARTLGSSWFQCKKIQHNKWRIPTAKPSTSLPWIRQMTKRGNFFGSALENLTQAQQYFTRARLVTCDKFHVSGALWFTVVVGDMIWYGNATTLIWQHDKMMTLT